MEDSRLKVVVLFGGRSGEHEVSLHSAKSVLQAIDKESYIVQSIGISKMGQWYWGIDPENVLKGDFPAVEESTLVTLVHDPGDPRFIALDGSVLPNEGRFDIIFPVLHGPYGEDGTLQGLLEIADVPYVGSGVLGSSLGMDKDRMKAVFEHAGLRLAKYITLLRSEFRNSPGQCLTSIEKEVGYPCFIKPANLGSSVGISKVRNRGELLEALNIAAVYDRKIIIEENVTGREIEVSVLGNENPQASLPGEILPAKEFYDYEAKYQNVGSRLLIPADLQASVIQELQEKAVIAFQAVDAAGLSRVDFFVTAQNEVIINEINTMPGFTTISMYPKLWEESGINYPELIDRLITLAFERFREKKARKISM